MLKNVSILLMVIILAAFLTGCSLPSMMDSDTNPIISEPGTATLEATDDVAPVQTDTISGDTIVVTPTQEPARTIEAEATPDDLDEYRDSEPATDELLDETDAYTYEVQIGSPVALPNFAHPDLGCNWLGIGGQVFNRQNNPESDVVVEAGGTLEGENVFSLSLTGLVDHFGEGGYELYLSDHPVESMDSVWVELYSLTGDQLSERVYVNTYNDCGRNLIILNFTEIRISGENTLFFPVIYK